MPLNYRQLTDELAVCGQISADDVPAIKAAGFQSVICNRPDDEEGSQPKASAIEAAAVMSGLEYRYIPVVSGAITSANVSDMAKALDSLPGPVFAYCRSGGRCANLFNLVQSQRT
jgi:uncharacterized protein (TIGR01244 family)